jgi:hypothetical protein
VRCLHEAIYVSVCAFFFAGLICRFVGSTFTSGTGARGPKNCLLKEKAVISILDYDGGYSDLHNFLSRMDIPVPDEKTFHKVQDKVLIRL